MTQPTPAAGFTVSADLINGLIDCAVQCGVARTRLTDLIGAGAGATGAAPPARYAGEYILKLWDRIQRETGDPIVGFRMARVAGLKTFGVLGQIVPRCATVLEAYRHMARYVALASQGARFALAQDARTLTISLLLPNLPPGDLSRAILLWGVTNLSLLPERLTGVAVRPKTIACAFAAPAPADAHVLRQHCPFTFGAAESRVVFERAVGDMAVPSADADLQSLLAEVMDRHLAALGPTASFEQAMLAVLRGMLNGNMPTLASLSRRSGMSQRTLQRRLAESNTSFQRLLRQVLHESSDALLARQELSHGEIAFLLGYSEQSAFSRAYRSWTGHPPGEAAARR